MKNAWGDEAEDVRKVWRSIAFLCGLAFWLGHMLTQACITLERAK